MLPVPVDKGVKFFGGYAAYAVGFPVWCLQLLGVFVGCYCLF